MKDSAIVLGSFKVRGMEKNIKDGENGETYRVKKIRFVSIFSIWIIDEQKPYAILVFYLLE